VERTLRSALAGLSLVGEIDLDQDAAVLSVDVLSEHARCGHVSVLHRRCPASLAVALVRHGLEHYERNTFWDGVDTYGLTTQQMGQAFLNAIGVLGLEAVDERIIQDRGRRYVGSILMHGGIPKAGAVPLFQALTEELCRGVSDATEVLRRWEGGTFPAVGKPAERFLRDGRQLAIDLVDRMIDLVVARSDGTPDPKDFGLPSHIAAAFADMDVQGVDRRTVRRIPAPFVEIEPGTGVGPRLVIPTVTGTDLGQWMIETGDHRIRRQRSSVSEQTVDLFPSGRWVVDAERESGPDRRFEFEGHGQGVYLFDQSSGRLLAPGRTPSSDVLFVLCPAVFECRHRDDGGAPVRLVEDSESLTGAWSSFNLVGIDITDVDVLYVGPSGDDDEQGGVRVPVRDPKQRPVLGRDGLVPGVTWQSAPVFSAAPLVRIPQDGTGVDRWVIRVTDTLSGVTVRRPATDCRSPRPGRSTSPRWLVAAAGLGRSR
jgi:hypothetical protein